MDTNFAAIAFSGAAKAMQEKLGSRQAYARMEKTGNVDGLTETEIDFISGRDSFYMASHGESGFPYIQHRGGPKGFIKVLDPNRIGFIDFMGNKQYISAGNMITNNKVAIIMVDYPSKTRLKLYATAELLELRSNPGLFSLLNNADYQSYPERMVVLSVEAFDWNCPQHITPRYTVAEIEDAFSLQVNYIKRLEDEIRILKEKGKSPVV